MVALLTPTRNRATQLSRMIESARATAAYNTQIILYVDEDDRFPYEGVLESPSKYSGVGLIRGPRICLSQMWNVCARASRSDLLMMCNDDVVFKTPRWDEMIVDAFDRSADKILMVHGSPGAEPGPCGFAAHPVIHRKWVDTVGYFTWPYFSGDFADTFIDWIARELGRAELLPYALEHIHPLFQKGADDETYRDRHEFHRKQNPTELWEKSLPDRLRAIEKLRLVMR